MQGLLQLVVHMSHYRIPMSKREDSKEVQYPQMKDLIRQYNSPTHGKAHSNNQMSPVSLTTPCSMQYGIPAASLGCNGGRLFSKIDRHSFKHWLAFTTLFTSLYAQPRLRSAEKQKQRKRCLRERGNYKKLTCANVMMQCRKKWPPSCQAFFKHSNSLMKHSFLTVVQPQVVKC